jgi:uncharacterized protein YoaH (UPF0181 family)
MKKRKVKAKTAKKTIKKRRAYNPQIGQLTHSEVKAQARLEKLAKDYMGDGMTSGNARARAREELRDSARRDWRRG